MMIAKQAPRLTLEDYEKRFQDRHLLHAAVEKWAREKPGSVAIIDSEQRRAVSWAEFDRITRALAMLLLKRGFSRGDFFASLLPLTPEHVFLEYACFRIGVIFVPLDLRLSREELMRDLNLVKPAGFAFVQAPCVPDAVALCVELRSKFPLKLAVHFAAPEHCADGAISVGELVGEAMRLALGACATARGSPGSPAFAAARSGPWRLRLAGRQAADPALCSSRLLSGMPPGSIAIGWQSPGPQPGTRLRAPKPP